MNEAYFANYCGHGAYRDNYLFHSGIEHCLSIFRRLRVKVDSVLVLGAATGEVLAHFDSAWKVRPHGCEISAWAHAAIPGRYRRRIRCADLRDYLPELVESRHSFDLIFANSLVYLEAHEIPRVLEQCARLSGHFHFWSSTSEDHEPGDAYRVTLRSAAWWKKRFRAAGFASTRSPYVFRSERRGCWG